MTATRPLTSVVVPTRDRPDRLAACLQALDAQDLDEAFEVVVVDDGSLDASAVAAVVGAHRRARLVRAEGRGPAAARNLGGRAALAPLVAFTDDDCRPRPTWLSALVRRLADDAEVAAGPTVNGRPDDPFAAASQAVTDHLLAASADPLAGTVGFAPTSNVAARAEVLRRVPFDERFPTAAGEDRDWCARLAAAGIPIHLEPAAEVAHHQGLGAGGFWRQQVRYGRGGVRHRAAADGRTVARPAFYAGLLAAGWRDGPVVAGLVVVAQLATAVGVVRERRAVRRERTAARPRS